MKRIYAAIIMGVIALAPAAYAVDIQEVTAPKTGIKAWLVEDHHLPVIALSLAFEGGSEQDPVDKQGLATLTMRALTEGAGNDNATEFQHQVAARSITIQFDAERDKIAGGVKCLSADALFAFDMLRLVLTQPRFDAQDIARLRAQQISAIRRQFSDPNWQARYALLSHLYGDHPYGYRRLGTMQTVQNITRDDLKNFLARHVAQDNATIAVAGDIAPGDLATMLDKVFYDLPRHAALRNIPDAPETKDTPTILVKREGTQTDILFASPGPKRDDPDWYAAEIANYILGGGGFSSRLMQDVRDKKGLTYGIGTALSPAQHGGLVIGQAAVDNAKVAEAMSVMRDTMRRFYDQGATDREIAAAKDYLTGSEPLALTSTGKIADFLVAMQRDHLHRDFLDHYRDLIRSVTAHDVDRAIDRFFNPDKITWVMVGQPDDIAPTEIKETVKQ